MATVLFWILVGWWWRYLLAGTVLVFWWLLKSSFLATVWLVHPRVQAALRRQPSTSGQAPVAATGGHRLDPFHAGQLDAQRRNPTPPQYASTADAAAYLAG